MDQIEQLKRRLQRAREPLETQMTALWREFDIEADDLQARFAAQPMRERVSAQSERDLVTHGWSDMVPWGGTTRRGISELSGAGPQRP